MKQAILNFICRILNIPPPIVQSVTVPVPQQSVKVNIMSLKDEIITIEAHLVAAEPAIKAKWVELVAWIASKQATDATEIADLVAKGYTVTPPPALVTPTV